MSDETVLLDFDGLTQAVALVGCPEVLEVLPLVFRGNVFQGPWHGHAAAPASPVITLRRRGDAYELEAAWLERTIHRDCTVDLVCAFIAELAQAYLYCNPRQLCLHAAAAEFCGRLVVFPNTYRAGKSLLSTCLAAQGVRMFGDDILPLDLDGGLARAPGIQPRLRKPIPKNLSAGTLKFLRDRRGPESERYAYLRLSEEELAPMGVEADIGAFVVLERGQGVKAELSAIPAQETLRNVIWQNFARGPHAAEILQRLYAMVAGAQCYRLSYAHVEEAAALLRAEFTSWRPRKIQPVTSANADRQANSATRAGSLPTGSYLRDPRVREIRLDGHRFLADPNGANIFHLNPVGASIWHLLKDPLSLDEITGVLRCAFPETGQDQVRADAAELIGKLVDRELLMSGTG